MTNVTHSLTCANYDDNKEECAFCGYADGKNFPECYRNKFLDAILGDKTVKLRKHENIISGIRRREVEEKKPNE